MSVRKEEKLHIISSETPNTKGFVILNEGIDWSIYKHNPILLLEHNWGSKAIGTVENIHLKDNFWCGELKFLSCKKGKKCKVLYDEDNICSVSVGGVVKSWGTPLPDGTKVATSFQVFEISLVKEPSNPDANKLNSKK